MYIIIAGCRKIGSNLALILAQENHDVVVIDSDPKNFELLGSGFNGVTITGMPIDEDILRSAGIEQADALAAVTYDDNMNVMVSQIARELFGVPIVITRLYDPVREDVFNKMGLTTICPTTLAVESIKDMLLSHSRHAAVNLGGVRISFQLKRPARRHIGKSVAEISDVRVFGIIRNKRFLYANVKTIVDAEDALIISEYAGQEDGT